MNLKMINYNYLINKKVRVITMVMFKSGRKIKTDYIGELIKNYNTMIDIKELDGTRVTIEKRYIKRIEEIQ